MKYTINFILILYSFVSLSFWGCRDDSQSDKRKEMIEEMNLAIQQKDFYRKLKISRIDSIKQYFEINKKTLTPVQKFELYENIYEEYQLYCFDSAYHYAEKLSYLANLIDSPSLQVNAKTKLGYILARGGFFKESIDSLSSININPELLPDSVISHYYICFGRAYHDLADYTKDNFFSKKYNSIGNELLSASLPYLSDSLNIYYVKGKIALKQNKVEEAKNLYVKALNVSDSTDSKMMSVLYSTLGYIDRKLNLNDEAIYYYIMAAKNDIYSSTTESVALRGLATMLYYHENDVDLASEYINEAFEDATFYGTRHRMNVIGTLLPVFVGEKLDSEKVKRKTFQDSFILSLLFVLFLIIAIINALIQMKRIRRSRRLLERLNIELIEVNKIKDSYLGHYLDMNFKLIHQIDNFVLIAQQKLDKKQYTSLSSTIQNLNAEYNRKSMFSDFDNTFLSLFPSFVEDFNTLLLPEAKFILDKENTLNSTLRIFALIRLGITIPEQIANILGYTVSTVYNYRVRIRNKAIDPSNFEEKVKRIGL